MKLLQVHDALLFLSARAGIKGVECGWGEGGLTEDCIVWIHGHLVLGRIANETLRLRKGYIARCGPVALIVGNDLHFAMLKDPDARVRGAKINANRWYLGHVCAGFNNRPEVGRCDDVKARQRERHTARTHNPSREKGKREREE